jgi:hypothetical protein
MQRLMRRRGYFLEARDQTGSVVTTGCFTELSRALRVAEREMLAGCRVQVVYSSRAKVAGGRRSLAADHQSDAH